MRRRRRKGSLVTLLYVYGSTFGSRPRRSNFLTVWIVCQLGNGLGTLRSCCCRRLKAEGPTTCNHVEHKIVCEDSLGACRPSACDASLAGANCKQWSFAACAQLYASLHVVSDHQRVPSCQSGKKHSKGRCLATLPGSSSTPMTHNNSRHT